MRRQHRGLARDARLVELLLKYPGITRADAARSLGWNRMRVTRAVRSLVAVGKLTVRDGGLFIEGGTT